MENESCYGGGDIAGAIFGTLFAVVLMGVLLWWLYRKNYIFKRKDPQLMPDDPEATAKGEYAFDNPAFKTTEGGSAAGHSSGHGSGGAANKAGSPLDPSWTSKQNTIEKRKTVDDSYVTASTPRLVALRGSDFTGLGVEVYGGLKEGIFVKKVMPQGPAAGIVNTGDRITSITIDFRHIVQEDAMTILSYASPYNVQLELVGGTKPIVPQTQSPKSGHQSLTHPLYRSSSQSDLNTIERNSRKKLFPSEDSPLKMDNRAASPTALNKVLPTVHKEHERETKKHSFKQQMKDMIEEKFQSRHADVERKTGPVTTPVTSGTTEEATGSKKGHKFGIRVFPPSVNDKLFGKSPTKVQADNENNFNIEKKESDDSKREEGRAPSPPVVKKRTKEPKVVPDVVAGSGDHGEGGKGLKLSVEGAANEFLQRQGSLNSSGIRRDAAGIPQEMPSFMMHAANAARDNRKSLTGVTAAQQAISDADNKRKGKAPRPPQNESELDESTVTVDTNLSSVDMTENGSAGSRLLNGSLDAPDGWRERDSQQRMNFSDNFAEEVLNCTIDSINNIEQFNETGPSNSSTPKSARRKTSSMTESEIMMRSGSPQRVADGEHESDVEQEQRRPRGNTIELNSSDITVHQSSASPTPASSGAEDDEQPPSMDEGNRRRASLGDLSKLSDKPSNNAASGSNTLERAQSLEISGEPDGMAGASGNPGSDTGAGSLDGQKKRKLSSEVQASLEAAKDAADGSGSLQRNRLKGASAWGNLEDAFNSGEFLNGGGGEEREDEMAGEQVVVVKENGGYTEMGPRKSNQAIIVAEAPKKSDRGPMPTLVTLHADGDDQREEHVSLTTISAGGYQQYQQPDGLEPQAIDGGGLLVSQLVKISTGYDTNIPDDVKVSRYPFGSLERPKSDVLKKLLGQKEELENTPSVFIAVDDEGEGAVSKIKIDGGHHHHQHHRSVEIGEPVSLTLINTASTDMVGTVPGSGQPSPVFTTSNTNGVSSINISSTEFDQPPLPATHGGGMAKFSLLADNIVTISTALDGQLLESQPSSIVMIDDEKLDFSLQTLDDFEDPLDEQPPAPHVLAANEDDDSSGSGTGHRTVIIDTTMRSAPTLPTTTTTTTITNGVGVGEPPQPPQRSSITMNRRGSVTNSQPPHPAGAPMTNGGGFVTEITLKTLEPTMTVPPTAAERPQHQLNGSAKMADDNASITNTTPTTTSFGKPPIVTKKPPKPESKPTTPPSRIPVERRMSSEHSFIPRNTEIKFTTATYESASASPAGPRTPTAAVGGRGGIDQIRSNFERSNSKTEIPVLIRRTSIPSINLSPSGSVTSGSSGSTTGGSMSNLSSISAGSQHHTTTNSTKASPSRIPVFNSVGSAKFGQNGHDTPNGGRSPPPPPAPQTNGGSANHHHHHTNGHLHSSNNNNNLVNNKVSVSITSIKNQAKYPSGKF